MDTFHRRANLSGRWGANLYSAKRRQSELFQSRLIPPGIPHVWHRRRDGRRRADIITAVSGSLEVFPQRQVNFQRADSQRFRTFKFTTADFNGDGKLDLGMIMPQTSLRTDTIATSWATANGTFQPIRTQTGSSVLESLRISNDPEATDFNGDQKKLIC